jgi:hypothetical protein
MPLFTVNFRREAYLKEIARSRRRLVMVTVWVAYFGVVAVTMGLYGLNCVSLAQRVSRIERRAERVEANRSTREQWQIPASEFEQIERYLESPGRWHDRLVRLSQLTPGEGRVTAIAVNPNNLSGRKNEERLVITGHMRVPREGDRMTAVMEFVTALRTDSTFAIGYDNVKLASSRIVSGGSPVTEFVIECQ